MKKKMVMEMKKKKKKKKNKWTFLRGFLPISQAIDQDLKIAVEALFLFI